MSIAALFEKLQEINPDPYPWMKGKTFTLIKSMEQLKEALAEATEAGLCAVDLETTGLDSRIDENGRTFDQIVGYCFAYNDQEGFYVPVRHMEKGEDGMLKPAAANLSPVLVDAEFKKLCANCRIIYHNSSFDQEFLFGSSARIPDPTAKQFEDTLILDYLKDSTSKKHGLKHLSEEYLGMQMFELKQLFPKGTKDLNFATLDPEHIATLRYACADGLCTFLLYHELKKYAKEQPLVYGVEKALVPALRWTERNRMTVDLFYAKNLLAEVEAMIEGVQATIYAELSRAFQRPITEDDYDINSPQKLGNALADLQQIDLDFRRLELETTEKSGQIKTNSEAIEALASTHGDKFPFLAKIQEMRALQKVASTYIRPLIKNTHTDSTIRFSFRANKVDTGRFAADKGKDGHGFSGINVQSMPATYSYMKPYVRRIVSRPEGPGDPNAELDPEYLHATKERGVKKLVKDNHFILDNRTGEELCVRKSCVGCPFAEECEHKGQEKLLIYSVENAIRPALVARKGSVLVAIDYSGLELRAAANICEEPKWIKEFYRCGTCGHEFNPPTNLGGGKWQMNEIPTSLCPTCGSDKIGDLHTLTAQIIYGDDVVNLPPSEFKQKRQIAKAVNFAIIYGGGGGAIARATGVDSKEGWEIRNRILKSLPVFGAWMKKIIDDAHKNLEVETAIGRKIRLWDINHSESWIRAKQERNAVNSVVQGTATGDLIKYAMAAIYTEVFNRGWEDDVRMVLTIHDELVFEIAIDLLSEALPVIEECMTGFAKKVKWPIPLVTDIEFNTDWSPKYDWTQMHSVNLTTGLAAEDVPLFMKDKIPFTKGMWYCDPEAGPMVYDGQGFIPKEEFLASNAPEPSRELSKEDTTMALDKNGQSGEEASEDLEGNEEPVSYQEVMGVAPKPAPPKPVRKATLPYFEYTSHVNLAGKAATFSYLARLRRVTEACRVMTKAGLMIPTHTLKVVSVQGDPLLPPEALCEIDPKVFAALAFYEGL